MNQNPKKQPVPNPFHQPETESNTLLQEFVDPEGGARLDDATIRAREKERQRRYENQQSDGAKQRKWYQSRLGFCPLRGD